MNKFWVIFSKELMELLKSPTFYIVAFLSTALFSFLFPLQLVGFMESSKMSFMQAQDPNAGNIHFGVFMPFLSILNIIMIFAVPAIVIRLLTEERRTRSFDLLLTSPITSLQIVAGKYFAALAIVFVFCALSLIYVLAMMPMVSIPWNLTLTAYLGLFFIGAIYAALSLFSSSLTESTVSAFVMAVLLNFFVWLFAQATSVVDEPTFRSIVEHLSLGSHVEGFFKGNISLSAFVYIFSFIGFFVFLAERIVESQRWR